MTKGVSSSNQVDFKTCLFSGQIKVAFGVELDLMKGSPFPKAIEMCLKGMVYNVRDPSFEVGHCNFGKSVYGERILK